LSSTQEPSCFAWLSTALWGYVRFLWCLSDSGTKSGHLNHAGHGSESSAYDYHRRLTKGPGVVGYKQLIEIGFYRQSA